MSEKGPLNAVSMIPAPVEPHLTAPDAPDNRYQVFQKSLLEHEFRHEDAFFSASLHRLQHGIYHNDERIDLCGATKGKIHVTFVAITFVFHPGNSMRRRFKRAQISIQAFGRKKGKEKPHTYIENHPLRIFQFAPHVVYGRVSTESLHWTFSLGSNFIPILVFLSNNV